jgi:exportin-2 (importin alpha re-exporter)
MDQITFLLLNSISPNAEQRKQATNELLSHQNSVDKQPGFATLLLQICLHTTAVSNEIRAAASVMFKNVVKNSWNPNQAEHLVQDQEKETLRNAIFGVMTSSQNAIQRNLAEAIAIMADVDFPSSWPNIVNEIVTALVASTASNDLKVVEAVMSTAHSVFVRYRKMSELTTALSHELLPLNKMFTLPLLQAMQLLLRCISTPAADAEAACRALHLSVEVLYDTIFLDMGDEHVANLSAFMTVLYESLVCQNPVLAVETEVGPLAQLQSAALSTITLFLQKYDEEFEPFAATFLQAILAILSDARSMTTGMDDFVVSAFEFLSVGCRGSTRGLLDPTRLQTICVSVVMPNLQLRNADLELYEDDPDLFLQREIEGSDLDTRRRSGCELIRALMAAFPQVVGPIFTNHVNALLAQSASGDWKAKDTAIFLVAALALEGSVASSHRGAKQQLSALVPLVSFTESTVMPELSSAVAPGSHEIVKMSAMRFVSTFRAHLPPAMLPAILQCLGIWVTQPAIPIHSIAAHTLERIVTHTENSIPLVSATAFQPVSAGILAALCQHIQSSKKPNPHTARCLMRIASIRSESITPYVGEVVVSVNTALTEAAKNPSNPVFSHCLFEILSQCIVVGTAAIAAIEQTVWNVLIYVLREDVAEYVPYALQILAQLLDAKQPGPLEANYQILIGPLLMPAMYAQKGTIPAVIRLLTAVIRRDAGFIHASHYTEKALGVFKQLVQLKQFDHEGLNILTTMVLHYPVEVIEPYMGTVYQVLFHRLQAAKTPKYIRCLILFFSVLTVVHGAESVVNRINSIQQGLFYMFLKNIWLANMQKVNGTVERKACIVALANLLSQSHQLQADREAWAACVFSCLKMIHCAVEGDDTSSFVPQTLSLDELAREAMSESGFSNVYCPLQGATPKAEDPCAAVADPRLHFHTQISTVVHGPNGAQFMEALRCTLSPDLMQLLH